MAKFGNYFQIKKNRFTKSYRIYRQTLLFENLKKLSAARLHFSSFFLQFLLIISSHNKAFNKIFLVFD